jgi:hypothetical protein
VSKYSQKTKEFILPANEHEKQNDPKLRKNADYLLEWRDVSEDNPNITYDYLLTNTELNQNAEQCLISINQKYNILSS